MHTCPDCGKHFEADDPREFLEKNPCRKARIRKATAAAGTCLHCGETDLPVSAMSSLSDGTPSNCCKDCHANIRAGEAEWKETQEARARAAAAAENEEGRRRAAWGRMTRAERKLAMAGEASGRLF